MVPGLPTSPLKLFLHLLILCGLAVAQPLYDLAGSTPEFLVAHRLEPGHLVLYSLLLSLALPCALLLLIALCHLVSRSMGRRCTGAVIALLAVLALLPAVNRLPLPNGYLAMAAAILAGSFFALLYFRRSGIRLFLTWFSIAGFLFPLNFLFLSPASQLSRGPDTPARHERIELSQTPPVILLVLDEFPLLSLLNSELEIDAGRFPNFAGLLGSATWYRFHTANSDSTLVSIPNLLSGSMPFESNTGLPTYQVFPGNLLALLRNHYQVSATEHGTRLCPETVCDPQPAHFRLLLTDSLVILGHVWLPSDLAHQLPGTGNDWLGFMGGEFSKPAHPDNAQAFLQSIEWSKRVAHFKKFVDSITDSPGRLYYMHSMFPHASWRHMPDGSLLTADPGGDVLGVRPNTPGADYKHVWYDSGAVTRVSRQRHILQVGYVDTLIGQLVARLRELGIYEQSLLVITSDHGASFNPGYSRRNVHGDNLADIAGVPLFIKFPGNQPSGASVRNAQAMDILPTILEALGAVHAGEHDGQSLLDADRDESRDKQLVTDRGVPVSMSFDAYRKSLQERAETLAATFGQDSFAGLYTAGDDLGLSGTHVDEYPRSARAMPAVSYRYADLLVNSGRNRVFTQNVVHGRLIGAFEDNPSGQLAVSVNGIIRAVTEPFSLPGHDNGFEALLPPKAFDADSVDIRTWFVFRDGAQTVLAEAPGEIPARYALRGDTEDGWSIEVNGASIAVERGEAPGWVGVSAGHAPGYHHVSGWAAEAGEPAEKILAFIDGYFYYSIEPDLDPAETAARFLMRGTGRSGFSFPVTVPGGEDPRDLEVRIFALHRNGKISELNYPQGKGEWVFRPNPRPAARPGDP